MINLLGDVLLQWEIE